MPRPPRSRALALAIVCLLIAGCGTEEQRRMRAVAGTYVWEYTAPLYGSISVYEKHSITLDRDGTWARQMDLDVDTTRGPEESDGGTYVVDAEGLSLISAKTGRTERFRVQGDTLVGGRYLAMSAALTGIDPRESAGVRFIRER